MALNKTITETEDLYNCEQCHLLFCRERIDGKSGPADTVCPECGNPWAVYWPEYIQPPHLTR